MACAPTKGFVFSKPPNEQAPPPEQRKTPPLHEWLGEVSPAWHWDWPHLLYLQEQLERITSGELLRLILTVPPRHGKSQLVTVRYPVWRLERDPTLRIIIGAYGQSLAEKFSRQARKIAEGRMALGDRAAAGEWETAEGGGVRAVGVGAGITGQGGDLIVVDDPVKSREEAESEVYRERVWDWFRDDLYTRLEPGAALVVIQTRWHEDDLAGRLIAGASATGDEDEEPEAWEVVNLPAIAEPGDPLKRPVGEALCRERYDEEALKTRRIFLGSYSFSALYQGRPVPREGGFFQRAWFEIVEAAPAVGERVRYWDKAATEGDGDYTAGVLMLKTPENLFYVLDVVRGQWSAGQREAVMRQTAEFDAQEYGRVKVFTEQEPGSGGKESAVLTVRNLAGFPAYKEPVSGSKEVRAEPLAAQAEAGNVKLVSGRWNRAFLDELCGFPNATHDDQVDGASGAFNKLALRQQRKGWRSARGGYI